ncbi:hypothetical protein DFH06DRAFT_1220614 [Mycena polygramma]|nr:hypothetical protein DFH06DRAFT_1220614 [Mycena polygramma]
MSTSSPQSQPHPPSTPFRARISRIPRLLRQKRQITPAFQPGSAAKELPKYSDTENDEACEKLWSIYATEAERYDAALVESWRADMEGMLIFSGLFSASVTAFLIESYHSLTLDSGDVAVQLLTRLSEQLAGNATVAPLSTPFHVPSWSIICNTLWFTSLTLSLTCALLATLVEQWAREFVHKAHARPSPVRRARVLSFLSFGVERFGMPAIVEVLPMLIHLALLLFFAGLVVFLIPVNVVVMALVAALFASFLLFYAVITILPTIALDCPYRTPLSGAAWNVLERLRTFPVGSVMRRLVITLTQAVIQHAFDESKHRDERAILWTVENLTDDNELLPFVEAIPDVVSGPKGFRQVNDHVFWAVLNTPEQDTSLGHRILNLLRDAELMPDTDTTKQVKQVSSLRAIWALCTAASRLPASRRGEAFLGWLAEANVFLSRFHNFPPALQISCSAVISNAMVQSMQSYVQDFQSILDEVVHNGRPRSGMSHMRGFTAALEQNLPELDPLSHTTLKVLWAAFQQDGHIASGIDTASIMKDLREDPSWTMARIHNTSRMLQNCFNSGNIPYNLEMTAHHIFPELHSPEWTRIRQQLLAHPRIADLSLLNGLAVWVLQPAYQSYQSPWRFQVVSQAPTHLDYMMRMVLRLLPFLRAESTLPFVYWYLANRTNIPVYYMDSFHPSGTGPQNFLDTADKVFIETKFIESMRSINIPVGTTEAVTAYYMQGINSEQTIDRVYLAAKDIIQSEMLPAGPPSAASPPTGLLSLNISLKAVLSRTVWGNLRERIRKVSADAEHREIDARTRIILVKLIQHPFLADHEPDIEGEIYVSLACASVEYALDEAYTSTLRQIVEICHREPARASSLIPALRVMCTLPEAVSPGTIAQQQAFIQDILRILAVIRQAEVALFRSAVLAALTPVIDWFPHLPDWEDGSENFLNTAILVDGLEAYVYDHGAKRDRRAARAVELRNHFSYLLWRMRNPGWAASRRRGSLIGSAAVVPQLQEDSGSAGPMSQQGALTASADVN